MVSPTGKVVHNTPILKKGEEAPAVSAPCRVRTAKTWELIKAHSETGLTVKQISEKMGISEGTVANAARNHAFVIRDEDGPINPTTYLRKHGEYQPPKAEPLPKPKPLPEPEPPKSEPLPKPQPLPKAANDPVNHPAHYCEGGIETIDFIEAKGLGYHLGNAVKYITRAGKKDPDKFVEDLRKAIWYINRKIEEQEAGNGRAWK